MKNFTWKGDETKEIAFPIGGIGTGSISLSGSGRLIDWEIFNKPNKGSFNSYTHFAIKAESDGKLVDARILNGDYPPPFTGVGHGVKKPVMSGVPHFRDVEFNGEYPIAQVKFSDEKFPGKVEMTAFNPFIPLNDKDSTIPGAFFEFKVENTSIEALTYTICFTMNNPHAPAVSINKYSDSDGLHTINLSTNGHEKSDVKYGELTIATDSSDVSYQEYWYRGRWFDNLSVFWRDFTTPGKLNNRSYPEPLGQRNTGDLCSLAVHIKVKPGESEKIKFVSTWNYPNFHNYWNPEKCECGTDEGCCSEEKKIKTWKNYYAVLFDSSNDSAVYSMKNWNKLYDETLLFKNALFNSSLPVEVIDAVSANISILKTSTCVRLEDGSFYAFEGCHNESGCCEGSCTHVWNYAYALPFLFPQLERSMRDLDYKYNTREDGSMCFRLQLPPGRERKKFHPCADGQFGNVIKAYRDWKICGDTEWLRKNWEAIKKSIDFAWAETNEDKWDSNKDGVLEGRQHHTLDMELYGPNAWLTGFYLGALKAGAEMAEFLGEKNKAREYTYLYEKGREWVNKNLFNGEYFSQIIDLKDKSILDNLISSDVVVGNSIIDLYWNDEAKEIKYQLADGCGIDQVLAQWHAEICGLGEIFDKEKTKISLSSIYKYNFKKSFRDVFNPCRQYAINDESGVVIFDWPEGKYKPVVPAPYSEEAWCGCEYQAASHMIREGLVEEGLEIVRAVRNRYNGINRNPWDEIECGHHYARSMSSFDLLLSLSGFEFDMVKGMIGFNPARIQNGSFNSFWSLDSGWGTFEMKLHASEMKPHTSEMKTHTSGTDSSLFELKVLYGSLKINTLKLPFAAGLNIKSVNLAGKELSFKADNGTIVFGDDIIIKAKDSLSINIK